MIKNALAKVVDGNDLTESEMMEVMDLIMDGKVSHSQIGGLLIALRMKGEAIDEIAGAVKIMRKKCTPIPCKKPELAIDRDEINVDNETIDTIVDTCGTGGDGTKTFNVSTTTAFVAAGAGLKVAKHGNRSVSSACGSADVIESLGVNLNLTPEQVAECINTIGIGFLYAPALHGAMKNVIGPRRELGLRTIFNLLGPLTNPAGASVQILGVYHKDLTIKIASVLRQLGCKSAYVVYGEGSYDEISITGPTTLTRLYNGNIDTTSITPQYFGLEVAKPEDIVGGDSVHNAGITLNILKGQKGPCRDMVLLNTSAVLVASEKVNSIAEGIKMAAGAIDSGRALEKLEQLKAFGK